MQQVLKEYWGYDSFLPLQREAMEAVISGRDSIVVLPTGGGKSLCYQAPAVAMDGMAVIVSPLISLMKDQVDALSECGVPAARLDSSLTAAERRDTLSRARGGKLKLLYAAPERVLMQGFGELLQELQPSFVAIDEAHCISMWGHDFRPEYQDLGGLKDALPGLALHAYTATATSHVRDDIAHYLRLQEPDVLVGSFDRPNLVYSSERRSRRLEQVCRVIDRHEGESGIVYCIRRADVDGLCAQLQARGHRALPYHAGMTDEDRKANQEAFIGEAADIIVATVAFGMGIDKPNVRYVVHAGMPKSLEHYQQESGRAGRDGLAAECCLFYSSGDFGTWNSIVRQMPPGPREVAVSKLSDMYHYATGVTCRHRALVNYFGQDLGAGKCDACDVCLGAIEYMPDSLETAQKILSCVLRLKQRFGGAYTAAVLLGSTDERILQSGHDSLSTYGLLEGHPQRAVRDWIEQLVGQGCLTKTVDFAVLKLTEKGLRVLKGEEEARLLEPARGKAKQAKLSRSRRAPAEEEPLEPADEPLFEALRALRKEIADRKRIPAYAVFSDRALRGMARLKPATPAEFLQVKGVGQKKCAQYADTFLTAIQQHSG